MAYGEGQGIETERNWLESRRPGIKQVARPIVDADAIAELLGVQLKPTAVETPPVRREPKKKKKSA
jgi:hypothetical protein